MSRIKTRDLAEEGLNGIFHSRHAPFVSIIFLYFSAIQYIANRAHESIGIDDVASKVGMSRSALTSRFRRKTDLSTRSYPFNRKNKIRSGSPVR